MDPRSAAALGDLIDVFDGLEIAYCVGGSVAATYVGEPRATMDVDLLIELPSARVPELVAALAPTFDVGLDAASDAVRRGGVFQALHLGSYTKFDVFVSGEAELDRVQLATRARRPIGDGSDREVYVTSPATLVLRKLDWYRRGDCVSENQWRDVLGVLKRQRGRLDLDDMRALAERLGLDELLERAVEEASA